MESQCSRLARYCCHLTKSACRNSINLRHSSGSDPSSLPWAAWMDISATQICRPCSVSLFQFPARLVIGVGQPHQGEQMRPVFQGTPRGEESGIEGQPRCEGRVGLPAFSQAESVDTPAGTSSESACAPSPCVSRTPGNREWRSSRSRLANMAEAGDATGLGVGSVIPQPR